MTEQNRRIVCSRVADCGGVPTLYVNGAPFPAAAYMTYLSEYNDYAAFAGAGYRLFSLPILFAGRWINAAMDNPPFHGGIFDKKDAPDFSALDDSVQRVLAARPDAYIFPRLNLAMPLWWIKENPTQTDGTGRRELLYSHRYRETASEMLRVVIRHIEGSDYAAHIVGYQLAGGNTEEWFHFDLNGGFCDNAVPFFEEYLRADGREDGSSGLPDLSRLCGKGPYHGDERLARYLTFANRSVAELICNLCGVAKEATGGRLAVGTFYGYSLVVSSPLWGTHALQTLLRCPHVDFICSPNSYLGLRDPNADWTEMYPADSVRLHGKLCLQECDIRTHLTRPLYEAAPEYDPERRFTAPIWRGLRSRKETVSMLRKSFARHLVKGNGFWWFDMWGGWFRDPVLLRELRAMREIYAGSLTKENRRYAAELAVFTDETAFAQMTDCPLRGAAHAQRAALGLTGVPYDAFDLSDFNAVFRRYRAVLFLNDGQTEPVRRAMAACESNGTPYLCLTEAKPRYAPAELRDFCDQNGVHVFCRTDDIVYVSPRFLAIHATAAGEKAVDLGGEYRYRELLTENSANGEGRILTVAMRANETKLFSLTKKRRGITAAG